MKATISFAAQHQEALTRQIVMAAANRALCEERDSGRQPNEDNWRRVLSDVAERAAYLAVEEERKAFAYERAELAAWRERQIRMANLLPPSGFYKLTGA